MVCFSSLCFTTTLVVLISSNAALAAEGLPDYETLQATLESVVDEQNNGGFGLNMWATIVDRDGTVQMIAKSGADTGDQWPGSRLISAQKAFTANAFSLPGLALSTANLWYATQPGQSLYGLEMGNPLDVSLAYGGKADEYGTPEDPLVGERVGGTIVFGGGLPLYDATGALVGGLGLSGDSSVADHVIAWRIRHGLGLDYVPGGVSTSGDDNMVLDYDTTTGVSASGWGHAATTPEATDIVNDLPTTAPLSTKAASEADEAEAEDEAGPPPEMSDEAVGDMTRDGFP